MAEGFVRPNQELAVVVPFGKQRLPSNDAASATGVSDRLGLVDTGRRSRLLCIQRKHLT